MRIAVTGAAGFVGAAIAEAAERRGWEVLRYARGRPAPYLPWDLSDGPLDRPPQVDAVVHCAAHVADTGPDEVFERVNVGGTRAVIESFPRTRLVHVSSSSVYTPFGPCQDRAEGPVADRHLNAYGRTKAAADLVAQSHPNSLVLRPHGVYGPGDRTLLPRLLSGIRGRTLLSVGGPEVRHQLTAVGTLAEAALVACESAVRGPVHVGDATPVSLGEALGAVLVAVGKPEVRIRYLPRRAAMAVAIALEVAARGDRTPRLSRYAVSQLAWERSYRLDRLRGELGVEPVASDFSAAGQWMLDIGQDAQE